MPKQFLPFFSDGSNLLHHALMRASLLSAKPVIVADIAHESLVSQTLSGSGVNARVLFETFPVNTAGAALKGALMVAQLNPEVLVCLMPCDHVIMDMEVFAAQVKEAAEYAASGNIVMFGTQPTPSSQYGFIIRTPLTIGEGSFYPVESFTEKPTLEKATALIETGRSFINSGIFVISLKVLLTEMQRQQPSLYAQVASAYSAAVPHPLGKRMMLSHPSNVISLPLDKAMVEGASARVVAPARFDWADVGSLAVLRDISARNPRIGANIRQFLASDAAHETA